MSVDAIIHLRNVTAATAPTVARRCRELTRVEDAAVEPHAARFLKLRYDPESTSAKAILDRLTAEGWEGRIIAI